MYIISNENRGCALVRLFAVVARTLIESGRYKAKLQIMIVKPYLILHAK